MWDDKIPETAENTVVGGRRMTSHRCPKCGGRMADNELEGFSPDRIVVLSRSCHNCGFRQPLRAPCLNMDHEETDVHSDGAPYTESCRYPSELTWAERTSQPQYLIDALRKDHEQNWSSHEEKVSDDE